MSQKESSQSISNGNNNGVKNGTEEGNKAIVPNSSDERDPAYFHYYGQLTHQQNMLQDVVRTSTYRNAILQNPSLFQDKLVMDIGAGSGILSYFAAQAGAKVIAVEASNMALKLKKILDSSNKGESNLWMKDRIKVVIGKIEEVKLNIEKVDTIISEPIGVMLVHERMIESYIYARDHYLKPGGAMVPSSGGLYLAPFTDAALWSETMMKARFWEQTNFYGVDLSPLQWDAKEESFMMPVVGYFDPNSLVASPNAPYMVDFTTVTMEELFEFEIPFTWTCSYTGMIHGISSWFDIHFNPPSGTPNAVNISMSTGPFAERTHWQQVRFLLKEPLAVNAGQSVVGTMKFKVNEMRSYDLTSVMVLVQPGQAPTEASVIREGAWSLHEQTYNYTYAGPTAGDVYPETNGMYVPEQELKQTIQASIQNPINGTFELNSATTSTTNN